MASSSSDASDVPPAHAAHMSSIASFGAVGAALGALCLDAAGHSAFADVVRRQIGGCDAELVSASAAARLRVQDEAYELLSARDALAEGCEALGATARAAERAEGRVRAESEAVGRAGRARANADRALEVVARTRGLVRMFARAEDLLEGRRVHAAVRTLERLARADGEAGEGVLRELLPEAGVLREEVLAQGRRAVVAWGGRVRGEVVEVGRFGVGVGEGGRDGFGTMWLPEVRDVGAGAGGQGEGGLRVEGGEDGEVAAAPRVSMRGLLAAILSCRDLGRMESFGEDYARERRKELGAGIEAIAGLYADAGGGGKADVQLQSHLIAFVAGFFVVERAVEAYSGVRLIEAAVLGEMWGQGWGVVTAMASVGGLSAENLGAMKEGKKALSAFAVVYRFSRDGGGSRPSVQQPTA